MLASDGECPREGEGLGGGNGVVGEGEEGVRGKGLVGSILGKGIEGWGASRAVPCRRELSRSP